MVVRLDMRVDMRRWVLVSLCSIGVMGGGCSARSLLSVEFTVEGESVKGRPSITVDWDSGLVRQAHDLPTVVVKEEAPARVGLYLDYEGDVYVSAVVHPDVGCDWTGKSNGPVSVRRGQALEVTIVLQKAIASCLTPDGGSPDAGAPIAEAGTDGPARPEVGPMLVPDSGTDLMQKFDACLAYCVEYRRVCHDWGGAELSQADCLKICTTWPSGDADAGYPQNTLACRQGFLRYAHDDLTSCSMCAYASPDSPGMCNSAVVDAGPRWDCPGDAGAEGP